MNNFLLIVSLQRQVLFQRHCPSTHGFNDLPPLYCALQDDQSQIVSPTDAESYLCVHS